MSVTSDVSDVADKTMREATHMPRLRRLLSQHYASTQPRPLVTEVKSHELGIGNLGRAAPGISICAFHLDAALGVERKLTRLFGSVN